MSEPVRSRTMEDASKTTDENNYKKVLRSKTAAGTTKTARRALGEVKVNKNNTLHNFKKDDLADRASLILKPITGSAVITSSGSSSSSSSSSSSKKRFIYRDGDSEEEQGEHNQAKRVKLPSDDTITKDEKLWRDLDDDEKDDICMVVDYTDDIFSHLYAREKETTPTYNYLSATDSPQHLRPSMRAILVDWLVEVHQKFQLFPETLYLAINLMDRFMSLKKVSMSKLQLLAVSSLFIAAKFEEVNLPKLSNYAYITDGACTKQAIKEAEMYILTTIQFNVGWPNPMNFLRRISKADDYDHRTRTAAKFFLEYAVSCPKFIEVVPSQLSAMAMYCARQMFSKKPSWDPTLKHYSGDIDALADDLFKERCRLLLGEIVNPSTQLKALKQKYRSEQFGSIGQLAEVWCAKTVEEGFRHLFE